MRSHTVRYGYAKLITGLQVYLSDARTTLEYLSAGKIETEECKT